MNNTNNREYCGRKMFVTNSQIEILLREFIRLDIKKNDRTPQIIYTIFRGVIGITTKYL